ncbi:protease complex subunit PrcB family protein [uncultured Flavobacterium sp.]|uniref:protease complex subunit PrcB family protein n=1 Tax=uncultured Flavobacterium sp. TaxID=165435 RepID=UPI0025FEB5E4|nr:protease complex subunit PrcB family protein [uncultured Flavobacterium sp.]
MKRFFTLALVALALTACKINVVNHIAVDNAITFEILKQEAYGGREKESTMVITSQSQLTGLYAELGWGDVPSVDFEKNNIVALFMGQKNSGGYSIGVKSISIENNVATIKVLETVPAGMATMAITNPYCIVMVPKTEKVVVE